MQNESDLLDTDLLPIRAAAENPPIVCEAAPTACAVVICFASFIDSSSGLEFEHQREVSSVSDEVMLSQGGDETSMCPISRQPSLSPFRYG